MGFSRQCTRVDCHFLLQGIFISQVLNPGLPDCRQTLYHLSHQGSPYFTYRQFKLPLQKILASHKKAKIPAVQSLSRVRLFVTPWIAARHASLSITNSLSSHRLTSIESMMPSSHLILCHPLLLPPIPPSIRVFSDESTLRMRWP